MGCGPLPERKSWQRIIVSWMFRQTTRDLLYSLSLANLSLFEVWRKINWAEQFLLPMWTWRESVASSLSLGLLTTIFFLITRWSRKSRFHELHLHRWLCLMPLIVLSNFVRREEFNQLWLRMDARQSVIFPLLLLLVVIYALYRGHRVILGAAEAMILFAVLLVPLTFGSTVWTIAHQTELPPLAKLNARRPGAPRVVWIVLDETDARIAFYQRPDSLKLPQFDRLRRESIFATSAYQAGIRTVASMPSMIAGVQSANNVPDGRYELLMHPLDHSVPEVRLSSTQHIFTAARQMGLNSGVVGWYIPYCRIFATTLSRCYWESVDTRVSSRNPDFWVSFLGEMRTLSPLEMRQRHILRYRAMLAQAKDFATDPNLDLVMLHLPVPHGPAIYDRFKGELTHFNLRSDWYYDNLALADRTLGDIRAAMEQAGMWDNTTVLVTSDHGLRRYSMRSAPQDPRVPYLLKLAGQKEGYEYTPRLSAMSTHDLLLAILNGSVRDVPQTAAWLNDHPLYPDEIRAHEERTAGSHYRHTSPPGIMPGPVNFSR